MGLLSTLDNADKVWLVRPSCQSFHRFPPDRRRWCPTLSCSLRGQIFSDGVVDNVLRLVEVCRHHYAVSSHMPVCQLLDSIRGLDLHKVNLESSPFY